MRVILIDDEQLALKYLEYQLTLIGDIDIVGTYTDPLQGRRAVLSNEVDIVFLDIHIPELNGIELAEILLEHKPHLKIVFVTTYDEYAIQAFELNALDYVLKPIRKDRLKLTVQRMKKQKPEINDSAVVQNDMWRINMFGEFTILDGKRESLLLHWRTSKAQEIFFYLLHHRGKVVSKSSLIELFWSDFDLQKAYSQLYTAVYHIRRAIGQLEGRIVLRNMADGYTLKLENLDLDIDGFERLLHSDMILTDDTILEYERALQLFAGEYLDGFEFDWLELKRQRLQLQWIRLKMNLVHWYVERQQLEIALKHVEMICGCYPLEEQAQFMYMKICDKMGHHFMVQKQFSMFESILEKEVSEKPSLEISQWYKDWARKSKKE